MKSKVAIALKITGMLVIVMIMLMSLLLIVPKFIGFQDYVIVSESMLPTLKVGTVVYVGNDDPLIVKEGDIITFYSNKASTTTTTHRVVSNDTVLRRFITKGDNNKAEDITPVSYLYYVGRVAFSIPYFGYVIAGMSNLIGKVIFVLTFFVGIAIWETGDYLSNDKSKKR